MKKTLLTSIFLFTSYFLSAQNNAGNLDGIVKNENGIAISYANIGITGTRLGTFTDQEGRFNISNVPEGNHILRISSIGYLVKTINIQIVPKETHKIEIILTETVYQMPQVNIFAEKKAGIFETVPGSLTYIDSKEMERVNAINSNEVLRRSPGVHVVEEEGIGMRLNLAVRGLDAARSRSTLILEDGIPLALAPYGEPEMYYAPAMEKMEGVEILKGSGSILYGPQTIGGIVNFITKDPPEKSEGSISVKGGQKGFFTGLFSYGNSIGKAGIQMNYLRKQADNLGPVMFRINDLSSKIKFQFSSRSQLGVKFGVYQENSNSTYIGMTQNMYDSGNYDFVQISPHDRLNVNRYNLSASHNFFINNNTKLTSTVFGYTTTRNWQRQDFAYNSFDAEGNLNPKPSAYTGITWGDETIEEGAIYMLGTSGNRNRTYEVSGAESRLNKHYKIGKKDNELITGVRFLHEKAFEQRINGAKPDAPSGIIMSDEVRNGYGTSAYAHNRLELTSAFSFTAGIRMENFKDSRDIRRGVFTINNEKVVRDTSIIATNSIMEFIPGAGFNLKLSSHTTLFGGVHKGFAPPRTKDAISNEGEVHELAAEKSWNYEVGIRSIISSGIRYEITGFYMDFSNQVIPLAEHAGGVGAGITNGGATLQRGIEGGVSLDFGKLLNWKKNNLIYDANVTFVQATFNSDRFMKNGDEMINVNGNKTPYAPKWLVSSALTMEHNNKIMTRVNLTYVAEQFSNPFNTITPSNNGREGLIPSYKIIDASLLYKIDKLNSTFNLGIKNLLNERYIASRRPQGIMMGVPRLLTGGFTFNF